MKSKSTKRAPTHQSGARSVPLASRTATDLRSQFSIMSRTDGMSVRVRGRELWGPLIVPAGTVYGDNILEFFTSPATVQGRLSRLASTYERFKFLKLVIHYANLVAATEPGSVVVAFDNDIDDETPSGASAVARMLTNQNSTLQPVNRPFSYDIKLDPTVPYMYTSPAASAAEPRTEYQGSIMINWAGDEVASEKTYGHLFLDYEIELRNPQLEELGVPTLAPSVPRPDPTDSGTTPARSPALGTSLNGAARAIIETVGVPLIRETMTQYLKEALYQAGASHKIPLSSIPGWNEKFIRINPGETLRGIFNATLRATPLYTPAAAAKDASGAVTATPAKLYTNSYGVTGNLYGTTSYDSLFLSDTGAPLGLTDYTLLCYLKNGLRSYICGRPTQKLGARWSDCLEMSTQFSTPISVAITDTTGITENPVSLWSSQSAARCPPVPGSSEFRFVDSGLIYTGDALTQCEGSIGMWFAIQNDTPHPAYLTAYVQASGQDFLAGTIGGMQAWDTTASTGTAAVPILSLVDSVPDFIVPVRLSETSRLLALNNPVASTEVAEGSAAAAPPEEEPPVGMSYRVPKLDPMPATRVGHSGH